MSNPSDSRPIRAVYFDVGETLINESTEYGTWADWLGVPRHTFSAVFGQVIAQGHDYREVFQHFRPGFDLATERQRRADAGLAEHFNGRDLYPDVRSCIAELKAAGLFVGVAGNQTARAGRLLHELNLGVDLIATSDDWGAEKPNSAFFRALIQSAPCPAEQIAYVGDRLDNDILPARAAGLVTVFVKRGPWGYYYATRPEVQQADIRVDGLQGLAKCLADG
ncbi:HAD family hydrolase [Dactylosporangium matsuzakiense]|uniref:Haloacid dehalogenase n=1 Tax=Dactylosporangium matsuzakiense TaxID=53360 RepID=A0A9W6NR91_9ACTN|nr:HAD family hydrolase [Dactylosporangium matsuzakiense]UWZ43880.1 HAD family hydrolase [Dactylosporangium matsuzakiense]GLL06329.1 haloacid dehalogenase [Dactylosporangium matsuzakiense]